MTEQKGSRDIDIISRAIKVCEKNVPCTISLSFGADKGLENIIMKETLSPKRKSSRILFIRLE